MALCDPRRVLVTGAGGGTCVIPPPVDRPNCGEGAVRSRWQRSLEEAARATPTRGDSGDRARVSSTSRAGRPDFRRHLRARIPAHRCDLTRRVTPGGAGRKQGVARRVKVLDIRKGHRPPTCAGRVESDLEAIDVVPDVVRLVGMW